MRPEHWKAGDVSKLDDITEEGRQYLITILELQSRARPEALIAIDQLLEALGAEGHYFT